ncbi:MAG: hypothetical protein HC898_04600 [Phycisphaerales bacterium]|nr:hypothetical protein [Phycisphaerales bacterium]
MELLTQVRDDIEAAASRAEQAKNTSTPALEFQLAVLQLAFQTQARRGDIPPQVQPHVQEVGKALGQLTQTLAGLPMEQRARQLARLQEDFTLWRMTTLRLLREATDPAPMGLDDLPPEILEPYRGNIDGKPVLALEIFPAAVDRRTGQATARWTLYFCAVSLLTCAKPMQRLAVWWCRSTNQDH